MLNNLTPRDSIIEEVIEERKHQDEKWGGSVHDDLHSGSQFINLIKSYVEKAIAAGRYNRKQKMRKRLVQVAALVIAAIESFDRYHKDRNPK